MISIKNTIDGNLVLLLYDFYEEWGNGYYIYLNPYKSPRP